MTLLCCSSFSHLSCSCFHVPIKGLSFPLFLLVFSFIPLTLLFFYTCKRALSNKHKRDGSLIFPFLLFSLLLYFSLLISLSHVLCFILHNTLRCFFPPCISLTQPPLSVIVQSYCSLAVKWLLVFVFVVALLLMKHTLYWDHCISPSRYFSVPRFVLISCSLSLLHTFIFLQPGFSVWYQ